jgi:murein DD-endopeptidase MepM/ murein hydrolase activator NlpD
MNKRPTYTTISALIVAVMLSMPFAVMAATREYDGGESFSREMSNWSRGNSQIQEDIEHLDEDVVEDLPIPVLFGVAVRNLTKNYGDPRTGHSHIGLDIMAAEGTPIVSPTEAVVTGFGVWSGAGNYVQTAAPGGETFVYMHLSEIADIERGDVLEVGDVIGYVGHTGNAVATAPHLHFEIHDEDDETSDPYPRFTTVFDLKDKIDYLEPILEDDADDEDELAELLVTKFRSDFTTAKAQGLDLPDSIEAAMKRLGVSAVTPVTPSSATSSTVLKVGSRGTEVATLQAYLIKKAVGSGAKITADGAFGPMTRQALIEYQASVGLTADGVAGPKTLAYIKAH